MRNSQTCERFSARPEPPRHLHVDVLRRERMRRSPELMGSRSEEALATLPVSANPDDTWLWRAHVHGARAEPRTYQSEHPYTWTCRLARFGQLALAMSTQMEPVLRGALR